ncbi:MAG: MoaD/ThiS family protein, partial [Terriglobales bacterium]
VVGRSLLASNSGSWVVVRERPTTNDRAFSYFLFGGLSMSITIEIPTALRRLTAGTPRVVCSAANLSELFSELDSQFPDLKPHLRDEAGETRRFLNIYVNEEDIRFLGGASYSFQDGDEVLLVPSIAGGSE